MGVDVALPGRRLGYRLICLTYKLAQTPVSI